MQRRFKINVEGRDYDVLVEEITDGGSGLYPDRQTMRPAAVQSAPVAGVTSAPTAARTEAKPAAGQGDVVSPLSGVLLSIEVEVGQAVDAETHVATLEAMKTKTMITAGRSGKVGAIMATEGQSVEAGQALLTIA